MLYQFSGGYMKARILLLLSLASIAIQASQKREQSKTKSLSASRLNRAPLVPRKSQKVKEYSSPSMIGRSIYKPENQSHKTKTPPNTVLAFMKTMQKTPEIPMLQLEHTSSTYPVHSPEQSDNQSHEQSYDKKTSKGSPNSYDINTISTPSNTPISKQQSEQKTSTENRENDLPTVTVNTRIVLPLGPLREQHIKNYVLQQIDQLALYKVIDSATLDRTKNELAITLTASYIINHSHIDRSFTYKNIYGAIQEYIATLKEEESKKKCCIIL